MCIVPSLSVMLIGADGQIEENSTSASLEANSTLKLSVLSTAMSSVMLIVVHC